MSNKKIEKIFGSLRTKILREYSFPGWYKAVMSKGYHIEDVDDTNVRRLWVGSRDPMPNHMSVLQVASFMPLTKIQYLMGILELTQLLLLLRYEFFRMRRKEVKK